MVQVAGRAGRDNKPSTVFIQTYQKDHYAFADACQQNVHQFFLDEMAFRKQWLYPPVVRLCRVIVSDFDANDVEKSMRSIYNYIVRLPIRKEVIGHPTRRWQKRTTAIACTSSSKQQRRRTCNR